jgi:hypothetical protein
MRESYVEDLASYDGPAHALATREGAAKRWVRGARRPAIEPRNRVQPGCRRHRRERKATPWAAFWRAVSGPRGVVEPAHACDLSLPRAGRSHDHPPMVMGRAGRTGKAKAAIP